MFKMPDKYEPPNIDKYQHQYHSKNKRLVYVSKKDAEKNKFILRAVLFVLVLLNLSLLIVMNHTREDRRGELASQRSLIRISAPWGEEVQYRGPSLNQGDYEINISTFSNLAFVFGALILAFMKPWGKLFIFGSYLGLIYVYFERGDLKEIGFYVICFMFMWWLMDKSNDILEY